MLLLKEKIINEGVVVNNSILKVDAFLNHQIDPELMMELGREFSQRFAGKDVTKILTIESSGIAVALTTALFVPVVFARKQKSSIMNENSYSTQVFSFTKNTTNNVSVLKKFLPPNENILILDDFLANGEAAMGLAELVRQAGSRVVGIGIVIEKSFQPGRKRLLEAGYQVEALARIKAFEDGRILFADDND
jgi:xanthine phosphoribosyltransferase